MEAELIAGAVNWELRPAQTWDDFVQHFIRLALQARALKIELLVLPENVILELVPALGPHEPCDTPRLLSQFAQSYEDLLQETADSTGMTIVGGSHFTEHEGYYFNTSLTARPMQDPIVYSKNKLTSYERESWKVQPGIGLGEVDWKSRVGALICYDSEFPEAARLHAERGAMVLAVPAYTETLRGFQRVSWSCLARAVENQVFVIHSALVGSLGQEPVKTTYGASAIIAPSIEPFPESAILARTEINKEGIAVADIKFEDLDRARNQGDVRNWNDRDPSMWSAEVFPP